MPELEVMNADQLRNFMLRNTGNRNPDIDTGPDGLPYVLLSGVAEALAIQSQNAKIIANGNALDFMSEADVTAKYGTRFPRQGDTNASGYVTIACAGTGTTIRVGDTLLHSDTKNTYRVTIASDTAYTNGQQVPVESVDPGAGQNLAAGTVLSWSLQRSGCYSSATVYQMPDGKGLSGGRSQESLDEWKERIRDGLAMPAGHGNEQDIIQLIEDVTGRVLPDGTKTAGHGVPVEKGFIIPALRGPGTAAIAFTVKRDNWWESRAPSSAQMSTVYNYVVARLPRDFSLWVLSIADTTTAVDISVTLDARSVQWADFTPWPSYAATGAGKKVVTSATDPLTFTIETDDADYTGEVSPIVGQTIGCFIPSIGTFVRKKLLTVSGTGPWHVTADPAAGASDATYLPYGTVSPWTDALPAITAAVGNHIAKLGVGECIPNPPGDGVRQERIPRPAPGNWDNKITARVAFDVVKNAAGISDAQFLAANPPELTPFSLISTSAFVLDTLGVFSS